MSCLKKILGITRSDRIQNTKIRGRLQYHSDMPSVVSVENYNNLVILGEWITTVTFYQNSVEGHIKGNKPRGRREKSSSKSSDTSVKVKISHNDLSLSMAAARHLARNRDLRLLKDVEKPSLEPTSGGRL